MRIHGWYYCVQCVFLFQGQPWWTRSIQRSSLHRSRSQILIPIDLSYSPFSVEMPPDHCYTRCALDSDLVDPVVSQMLGLTPSSSAQALQLQRAQNHIADVNIYYTGQPHVKIESFTEAVLTAFCGQFAAELTEQLPRFQYVQTLNEEAPRHTEFLALFSAFSDTLDKMELPSGLKYPAANAAPSPNSIDPADTEEKEKQTRTASV